MKEKLFKKTDDPQSKTFETKKVKGGLSISFDGKRVSKKILTAILATVAISGIAVGFLMAINSFFNEHYFEFRTPVIFQAPILIHEREQAMLSPLPEEFDLQVQAQEPTPTPEPGLVLSVKAQGCVENYPEVAEKLKAAFGPEASTAIELVCRESSLNPEAVNRTSGAAGLFQAYPASKLGCDLQDVDCQIAWGKNYIESRYETAEAALLFHDQKGWY